LHDRKETQWKDMVHFDPDAPEAKSLEIRKKEVNGDLTIKRKDISFFFKKKSIYKIYYNRQ
jgi:hypothetical protein